MTESLIFLWHGYIFVTQLHRCRNCEKIVEGSWKIQQAGLFNPFLQGSHSDWKTWKNGKAFSSQGKVREFWWDRKSQGKSHKILENWGNFRQMLFVIFQWRLNEFVYYLLNLIKFSVKKTITEKILENGGKILEKSGNFVSPEKWEPCFISS